VIVHALSQATGRKLGISNHDLLGACTSIARQRRQNGDLVADRLVYELERMILWSRISLGCGLLLIICDLSQFKSSFED
jgi:hypothetical protein